ncbi:hypothetical protein [Marinilabilia salmonicolor]|uniref:hypothetical protein n=1 Tax=Marinilabilia salmonicolor TaxID=989 RepID=UPI00029B30D0|nr:hypothetical protein [Marinilabilia salmonicolor]
MKYFRFTEIYKFLTSGLGVFILLFVNLDFVQARNLDGSIAQALQNDRGLNVYWDCSFCDIDYIKREINYVNYVRDRKDADVHVMVTLEGAANRGDRYSVFLFGQKRYQILQDTLRFNVSADASEDMKREKILHALRSGLTPYLNKTSLWESQTIKFVSPATPTLPEKDNWNNWIFKISADGDFDLEESKEKYEFGGEIEANKVTEKIKLELDLEADYEREVFDINSETVVSIHKTYDFDGLWVSSLSQHWSVGGFAGFRSSKYDNLDQSYRLSPAIEFSVFPYKEASTSQLTVLYKPEYVYNEYQDSTIFGKTEENLARQSLALDYEVRRKWGTVDLSMDLLHYFHDFSKNRMSFRSSINVNIIKGLSVYFNAGASFIHDQLALRKGDATTEEVLTQQKELATNFEYYSNIGISYTFGSMFNNIVNPRF